MHMSSFPTMPKAIIQTFISNPRSLVKHTLSQRKGKSVEEFQLRFLDYLRLMAYITGSKARFDDKDTIALFVEQLADSNKILNLYCIERNVPEKKPLYQPEMIVSTVKQLLQECAPAPKPYVYWGVGKVVIPAIFPGTAFLLKKIALYLKKIQKRWSVKSCRTILLTSALKTPGR